MYHFLIKNANFFHHKPRKNLQRTKRSISEKTMSDKSYLDTLRYSSLIPS